MKQLILFISLFIFGNSIGQTLTILNNSSIDVDFYWQEHDDINCQSAGTLQATPTTLTPGNSYNAGLVAPGSTMFSIGYFREFSTGITQSSAFHSPYSCIGGGVTTSNLPFGPINTVTWIENSTTHDVTVEIK